MIVPITKQPNGEYNCNFLENRHIMKTQKELAEMQKLVADSGFYSYIADSSEIEELRKDRSKFNNLINELILDRMRDWMRLADERLPGLNVQFFMLQGNDDD
ncbi:MAG: hypothetical protein ABSD41_08745, partial [Candidatus Bathyarchaeia archaeon]